MYYAFIMIRKNLLTGLISTFMTAIVLTACSIDPTIESGQQQLAADIYAQLALGYMESGHLTLAEQRLYKALELMPNGDLTLKAAQQWQTMQVTKP
jgi:Tfp pilus assembly protein PilF